MRGGYRRIPSNGVGKMVVFYFVLACFTSQYHSSVGGPVNYSVTSYEAGAHLSLFCLSCFNGDATLKDFFCQTGKWWEME